MTRTQLKIALIILFAALVSIPDMVSAQTSQKLTLKHFQNSILPITNALKQVSKIYDTKFVYEKSLLEGKTTSYSVKNIKDKKVEDVLKSILYPEGLIFLYIKQNYYTIISRERLNGQDMESINKNTVQLENISQTYSSGTVKSTGFEEKDNHTVSGKVTDNNGKLLEGVSVKIEGSDKGSATDAKGEYSIPDVPDAATLVFSYVGFITEKIPVNGRSSINVVLDESNTSLNEVVVVGYGTQRKRDVTGTVSTIKGDDFKNLPVSNAASALEGRASGVGIVFTNGSPGGVPNIRIRGTGTINNAEPLVVIDGVPAGGLNDVNPNDIASIEILKDASSSAIYGSRAANGVVLVTTKKGNFNQPMKTTVNFYTGSNKVMKYLDLLTAPELASLKQEAYTNDGIPVPPIWDDPNTAIQRTDWQKAVFKTGKVNNADVAIRGGSASSTYSFSGNYYDETGIIPTSYFKRYNFRINSDHKIGKRLRVGENVTYSNTSGRSPDTESPQTGLVWSTLRFNPSIPTMNADGSWGTSQGNNELGDINNPLASLYENPGYSKSDRILANGFAELEILKGLKVRANYGYDQNTVEGSNFSVATPTQTRGPSSSSLNQSFSKSKQFLEEYFLTYDQDFHNKHKINLIAGYSSQVYSGNYFSALRSGYTDTSVDQRVLNLGQNSSNQGSNYNSFGLQSYFVRGNYSFKGKYLLTATFRSDGSSKFAPGKRWGNFPAFSVGWRVSDEKFFANVKTINSLKITGGWGQLGNQNIGDFQYLSIIGVGNGGFSYNLGSNTASVNGAYITSLANPNITWEKAEMTNIGLEFVAFNNHISGTVTYFNKNTTDMLVLAQLVQTYGTASLPNVNLGEINNRGVEVDLNYQNKVGKISYMIGGNGSFLHNEVTKLYGNTSYLGSPVYGRTNTDISRTYEGQPIASFFGFKTDGLYQSQSDIDKAANIANDPLKGNIKPGDVRFVDINGDGIIDNKDRVNLGDPNPRFEYGFHGSANYANFDFSFNFTGAAGVKLYNADRLTGLYSASSFNWYAEQKNRWHGEGTSNTIPRVSKSNLNDNYRSSDLWVQNGAYLSLKSISLGYTLTKKNIGNLQFPDIHIYVSSYNVFYITKYQGFTPEIGYTNGNEGHSDRNIQRGIDVAQYPQSRNFTVGATINF